MTKKLIQKYPSEIRLRYNLAICLNERAYAIFNMKTRKVVQTKQAIEDCQNAKSLFLHFTQQFQKSDGKLASFILPSSLSKDEQFLANQQYAEMNVIAEERLSYIEGQLQHCQLFLKFDEDREMKERAIAEEAERKAEAQKEADMQELARKEREEAMARQKKAEQFYANLDSDMLSLDLHKKQDNKGAKDQ